MCPSRPRLACLAILCLLALGCRQRMDQQPYYRPYAASDLFPDGSSARPIPPDTVAQGTRGDDPSVESGMRSGTANSTSSPEPVTSLPIPVTHEVLARGQTRFDIFCSVCHGAAGYGDGLVVQRGFTPPPSFHTDALRQAPDGHFFDVITNGFGAMPSYAAQIPVADRWAIVAYIRALQRSQHASLDDVPADQRAGLEQQP